MKNLGALWSFQRIQGRSWHASGPQILAASPASIGSYLPMAWKEALAHGTQGNISYVQWSMSLQELWILFLYISIHVWAKIWNTDPCHVPWNIAAFRCPEVPHCRAQLLVGCIAPHLREFSEINGKCSTFMEVYMGLYSSKYMGLYGFKPPVSIGLYFSTLT